MSACFYDDLGERLITEKQVREKIGFGRKWVWQACKEGRFPAPLKIGTANRWRLSDVDRWLAALT
ncbi:helix-turn-helix transcriptional regulator [Sphingobium arseniciresistens]|uniref:helix-turn-helix transcriptional regulator n=1 Tax=Sphingobium arseniciresistens TaxID=3030834 RepID=UPI003BB1A50F